MMYALDGVEKLGGLLDRHEVQKTVDIVGSELETDFKFPDLWSRVHHYLIIGPEACGKSSIVKRLIYDKLQKLAEDFWLHYTGVMISAPRYVKDGITLPQEKKADLIATSATVIAKVVGKTYGKAYIGDIMSGT